MPSWNKNIRKISPKDLGLIFEGHMNCVVENCRGKIIFFNTDTIKACPECGRIIKKDPELLVK